MEIGTIVAEQLMSKLMDSPEWMDEAPCVVQEVDPHDESTMFALCQQCPFIQQCSVVKDILRENKAKPDIVIAGEKLNS